MTTAPTETSTEPKVTPLFDLHTELGGKLVDFAGYRLPVQYSDGIIAEHNHTRSSASLFDVSHMGQVHVWGADASAALEALLPIDCDVLPIGQQQYTLMLNEQGGCVDDLIVSRLASDSFLLVMNASRLAADLVHLAKHLSGAVELKHWDDRALIALQGPRAAEALQPLIPVASDLTFLQCTQTEYEGVDCFVSRSGYTGEDGFEISLPADLATDFARRLLAHDAVEPAGLGARDTLRLEAGLCLYGQDLDETTSPIEAGLAWAIARSRRQNGAKAGGFIGAETVMAQLADGVSRRRVGLRVEGRAPVRAGETLLDAEGNEIGKITSGGFAPSVEGPIAHAYVAPSHRAPDTTVYAQVRGRERILQVVKMPFVAQRYHRP